MRILQFFLFPFLLSNAQEIEEKNFALLEQCMYWDGRSTDSLIYFSGQLDVNSPEPFASYTSYIKGRSHKSDSLTFVYLSAAYRLAKEDNNPHLMARSTYRIGRILSKNEQYDSALQFYNMAQELFELDFQHPFSDAARQKALIHTSQAFVNIRLNNYERAIDHSLNSLKISESEGHDDLRLISLLNLSAAYGEYRRKDMATGDRLMALSKRYMFEAAALAEQLQDIRRASRTYGNIGIYYEEVGNLDSAMYFLHRAIDLAVQIDDTFGLVNLYNSLGAIHLNAKEADSAELYVELSMQHANQTGQELMQAEVMLTMADVQSFKGGDALAQLTLQEVLNVTKRLNAPRLTASAYRKLYRIAEEVGQDEKALDHYRAYISYRDSVVSLENLNRIEELKTQHDTEKKERQIESLRQGKTISELQIRQKNALLVGGAILVVVLAMIGYVFYRNRTLRLAQERLVTEQQLLRSQMNPHFLFNALSSIHSYVYEGDRRQAADYLATFGELTRDILDQSSVDWITLQKELKTIQQYIEIQQIRFPHVSSETFLSDNIMVEDMSVPPVLLQPFIENAFEHGLSDQKEGAIKIRIDLMDESSIIFEIEDDGVGLNESQSRHESKAISITRKRLELSYGKGKFGLEVSNADGSSGVLVRMVLPMKQEV